jgi:hypothetical protein
MPKLPFKIDENFKSCRAALPSLHVHEDRPANVVARSIGWAGVFLGLSLAAFIVTPAPAQGALGRDVSVIVVNPSPTHQRLAFDKALIKKIETRKKDEAKAAVAADKARQKIEQSLRKDYEKKLKDQRKNSRKK